MRVLVTGATGFVGRRLVQRLKSEGHGVIALSRRPAKAGASLEGCEVAAWPAPALPPDPKAIDRADAIIHLAGENVAGLWTKAKRTAIENSRVLGTRSLVDAIGASSSRPKILVSASAIGFYGSRGEDLLDESASPTDDFLSEVCQRWEAEAQRAEDFGLRVAIPRIGIVLGRGGGALASMELPFKLGLGGALGSGRQWWSWVLLDDLISMLLAALNGEIEGPFNAVAPQPVRQKAFAKALGRQLRRPAVLPAPAFALKLLVGGFSWELLSSKRVQPAALQSAGFEFEAESLGAALRQIYG